MPSPKQPPLPEGHRRILLRLAESAMRHGLTHYANLPVHPEAYSQALRTERASFVTLQRSGQLRGCIGTLTPHQPLVQDVASNAHAAAFRDPRFAPLHAEELPGLDIHISVLGAAEPIRFESERQLIARLRPGQDGLILEDRGRRGTFLPSVWESLPDPVQFLQHLKRKAGLPLDYWSETISVQRYEVESFGSLVAGTSH